ncbi:MAG: glycosyltransferase family 4 protein, partial [Bacteroidales bacterium]|nr:glycosyltransferase family 4 protein [Bacteroidales bacterium]
VTEDKVFIVQEAVNTSNFRPIYKNKDNLAASNYGIKFPYILFVSALWPYKNALNLVRAFAILVRKHKLPNYLVIVGSGWESYKKEIIRESKDSGVFDRIVFTGHIDNTIINAIYSCADVFVYPSYYETFGLTVLEAMASGTPVVASNSSSIPEVVGDAGLLVDPDSIEKMAEAIYQLISNDSLRNHYLRKGLERAKLFTWEKTVRETVPVYEEACRLYSK